MCVFKLFVLIVFRVGTTNTPGVEVAVVVVLVVRIGLGQLHDGLGVGAHGGQRDLCVVLSRRDGVERSRPLRRRRDIRG